MAAKKKKKKTKKKAAKRTAKRTTKKRATKKRATKKKATKKRSKVAKRTVKKKKKTAKKKAAKKKRKPNLAFMKPVQPDAKLAAVVGSTPIPRTELTKKLWIYIKKHKLQDDKNRRMINADANLKQVFNGKKQVSMFEMTKLVSRHVK